MNNILDLYFDNGLVDLGDNDSNLEKIRETATALSESLQKDTHKIVPYALVALDANIPETEPVLEEVQALAKTKWQTIRSRYREMPITLYRAILLQALAELVTQDEKQASTLYLASVDVYPFLPLTGKEKEIIEQWLSYLGNASEDYAVKEWTIDRNIEATKLPKLKIDLEKIVSKVDVTELEKLLTWASGPHDKKSVSPFKEPNPHWTNNPPHWSYEFVPRASKGIAIVVNKALEEQTQNIGTIQDALNKYFANLAKSMQASLQDAIQSSVAVERRSQLLWWKETLYSRTLQKSYRQLEVFSCAVAMAVDLQRLLPDIYPVSVDYILRESYRQVHPNAGKTTLQDFLAWVHDTEHQDFLKDFIDEVEGKTKAGRIDLHTYLQMLVYQKADIAKDTPVRLGVEPNRELAYDDLSVWLLHCLSVKHLTEA